MRPLRLIALTTDFGTSDPFVGIMKGVIASIAPGIPLVDITHAVPPGDIQRGAIVLWQSAPYFPPGTVFLSVVDPGVGTERKGVILSAHDQIFVGPDNGLFSYLLAGEAGEGDLQAWELANMPHADLPLANMPLANLPLANSPSSTFHGRDVFAPSAARAALGVEGADFGPACPDLIRLPSPTLKHTSPTELRGEILTTDQFGNLLTSLGRFHAAENGEFQLSPWLRQPLPVVKFTPNKAKLRLPSGQTLPFIRTFAQAPPGNCAILVGSTGLLEIVAKRQPAAEILNLKRGDEVLLNF